MQQDYQRFVRSASTYNSQDTNNLSYQFALVFSKKLNDKQIETIVQLLVQRHFHVFQCRTVDNSQFMLFLGLKDPEIYFSQASNNEIYRITQNEKTTKETKFTGQFLQNLLHNQIQQDLNNLNPAINLNESKVLVTINQYVKLKSENPDMTNEDALKYFTSEQKIRIIFSYLHKITFNDLNILTYLQQEQIIQGIFPLHDKEKINDMSIQAIEDYFGTNVSIYFQFMNFYQQWLVLPAALSLILFIFSLISSYLEDPSKNAQQQNEQIPYFNYFYSLINIIWSNLFLIFWIRQEKQLSVKWDSYGKNLDKSDKNLDFQGYTRINLWTQLPQEYYPQRKRLSLYLYSIAEAIPVLIITLLIKMVILNITGLISDPNSIFFLHILAFLHQEGGLIWKYPFIKSILNVVVALVIFKMNKFYTKVSVKSTSRENHKTNQQANDSVILKRFFFELINRFSHFFYIAFMIFKLDDLRSLLSQIFLIDEIRKIGVESILPVILKKSANTSKEKTRQQIEQSYHLTDDKLIDYIVELSLWEYDDFDDYIEVIFQFVYITVFAAVFPLSSFLSFIFNLLEIRSDKFQLVEKLYTRNMPHRINSIGKWNLVLFIISIMSIYSNITFLAFSHFQVFIDENEPQTQTKHDSVFWDNILIMIFIIEHIILLIIYLCRRFISKEPFWVTVYGKRRALRQNQNA